MPPLRPLCGRLLLVSTRSVEEVEGGRMRGRGEVQGERERVMNRGREGWMNEGREVEREGWIDGGIERERNRGMEGGMDGLRNRGREGGREGKIEKMSKKINGECKEDKEGYDHVEKWRWSGN